jgi:hypothetical protein
VAGAIVFVPTERQSDGSLHGGAVLFGEDGAIPPMQERPQRQPVPGWSRPTSASRSAMPQRDAYDLFFVHRTFKSCTPHIPPDCNGVTVTLN